MKTALVMRNERGRDFFVDWCPKKTDCFSELDATGSHEKSFIVHLSGAKKRSEVVNENLVTTRPVHLSCGWQSQVVRFDSCTELFLNVC